MMTPTFHAHGTLRGRTARIRWRDGALEGDEQLVDEVEGLVEVEAPVSIAGLYDGPASVAEGIPAQATVLKAMPDVTFTKNTVEAPDTGDGING